MTTKKANAAQVEAKPLEERNLRAEMLHIAGDIVSNDRNKAYGQPEDNFQNIADYWNVYIRVRYGAQFQLTNVDVALMHDLMKTARLTTNPHHSDSWIDKAGYSACGFQCAMLEANKTK